jgi:hypothetical protein
MNKLAWKDITLEYGHSKGLFVRLSFNDVGQVHVKVSEQTPHMLMVTIQSSAQIRTKHISAIRIIEKKIRLIEIHEMQAMFFAR